MDTCRRQVNLLCKKKTLLLFIIFILVITNTNAIRDSFSQQEIYQINPEENQIVSSRSVVISDFSDFTIDQNHSYIYSNNLDSILNFSYIGETIEEPIFESFNSTFEQISNITNFDINFNVNYKFNDTQDIGNFKFTLWSRFDETGDQNLSQLCSLSINDNWTTSTGNYEIIGYQNDYSSSYNNSVGLIPLEGKILFHANRTDEILFLAIINSTTDEIILSHTWISDVKKAVDYFQFELKAGGENNSLNIQLTDFSSFIKYFPEFSIPSYPFVKTYSDFSDFVLFDNDSYIESIHKTTSIDFIYTGTGSNQLNEYYVLNLDKYGNCSDFSISFDFYLYYANSIFGSFEISLFSYFNENGDFVGTQDIGDPAEICFASVMDLWTVQSGTFKIGATPNDLAVTVESDYGTLINPGWITFVITRNNGYLSIQCIQNSYTLSLYRSQLYKPLNYITIGSSLETNYNSFTLGNFTNFNAELIFDNINSINPFYQNDGGSAGDAGDSFDTAKTITAGSYSGTLPEGDEYDYYKIYVESGDNLAITLSCENNSDLDLYLYNPYGGLEDQSLSGSSNEYVSADIDETGYWVINIHKFSGNANYIFTVVIISGFGTTTTQTGIGENAIWVALGIILGVLLLIITAYLTITKRGQRQIGQENESITARNEEIQNSRLLDEEINVAQRSPGKSVYDYQGFDEEFKGYSFGWEEEEKEKKKD